MLRPDAVAHVFSSELQQNLGQELDVGTQHVEGLVNHFNEVTSMLDEAAALDERFVRFADLETKNDLGIRFLVEEPCRKRDGLKKN